MGRSPIRVLLIEDEETDYLLTRRMLSSVEGQPFALEWADSWQAGIEAIRRCAHDVCLLDFRIGGGDGLELLKESRDVGCHAAIIILTGVDDYRLDVEAMELGAADYLVKNKLTPELLERSIRYAIAQANAVRQLQQHQESVRAFELRFRSVVESAADAIILADEAGKIVFWNHGAGMMFGYSEDEVIGSLLEVLMPERYRERHRAGLERFCVTGRSQIIGKTIELEGQRKDGSIFPLELSLSSWRNNDGTMFAGIIRDITERRRAEHAEQASLAKSGFVARMSHELRTPLHAIIGFTNLLLANKRGNLKPQDLDLLNRVLLNAKDQLQLINGILDLSKVEAGRMDVQKSTTSLEAMVQELVQQLEGRHRGAEVDIAVRIPQTIRSIETDPHKLKQILMNLVDNALKFTEHGTITIQIVVSPIDGQPQRIDIIDTGRGIPSDRLKDIFEPFLQIHGRETKMPGTGLGLSICRSLCDLLDYELKVVSEPGRGSTFSVILGSANRLPLTA